MGLLEKLKKTDKQSSAKPRLYATGEAFELLKDKIAAVLGKSWTFVNSKNAFKKKDGDFTIYLYIWRSHSNISYERIIFDCNVTVDQRKDLVMVYQFRSTYHIESETLFNESWTAYESRLKTDVLPILNELNSKSGEDIKKLTSGNKYWTYPGGAE